MKKAAKGMRKQKITYVPDTLCLFVIRDYLLPPGMLAYNILQPRPDRVNSK
jgi:hypothetical protein